MRRMICLTPLRGLLGPLLPVAAALGGCGRVDFNDALYTDRCWEPGRCVAVMNLEPQLMAWLGVSDAPIDDDELRAWETDIEALDGTFAHIGVRRLSRDEKVDALEFLVTNQVLVLEQFGTVEEELLVQAEVLLARDDAETLARVRVGIAPYLQQTNGSVGVVNGGDDVLFLLGVDRLAYNLVERDRDETWARSVVAHELVHVTHFATSTYATSDRDDPPMERSLWVEGLAVWGSAHAGATLYSSADVFGDDFAEACGAEGAVWAGDYLAEIDDDGAFDIWWVDGGPDPRGYGVVTPGYCVAYLAVAAVLEQASFEEALAWEPSRAYPAAREALAVVAGR